MGKVGLLIFFACLHWAPTFATDNPNHSAPSSESSNPPSPEYPWYQLRLGAHGGWMVPGVNSISRVGKFLSTSDDFMAGVNGTFTFYDINLATEITYKTRQSLLGSRFLTVPLLIQWHLIDSEVTPYIELGPEVGFRVSGQDRRFLDIGLNAGAGLKVEVFERTQLVLSTRFLYGLTNTSRTKGISIQSRDLSFAGGFSFQID